MSYTLRGRLESRLAAAVLPFLAAAALAPALDEWWPLQLAGLMIGVGVALDIAAYHRLVPYQPGWLALPLGALELASTMGLAVALGVPAPLAPAIALFAGSWLLAQVLAHAGFPLLHLTYAEDGGELGRAGRPLLAAAPVVLAAALGVAWVTQPPTVRLATGLHQGPIVLDSAQRLVGAPGALVRGRILVTADDVTVKNLTVVGTIEVREAERVRIEDVDIRATGTEGILTRGSSVAVRDCRISALGRFTQGIEIGFAMARPPSSVEGCVVTGGREGIVSHLANVRFADNLVLDTRLAGISVTEMSMGEVEDNEVRGALGVAIFCGDYSHCYVGGNRVFGTRPDGTVRSRQGYGIVSHFGAKLTLGENRNADGVGAFIGATLVHD